MLKICGGIGKPIPPHKAKRMRGAFSMRMNKIGETFTYGGITFTVGGSFHANEKSNYEGLNGVILEIRDGADKDTDNKTPDIICRFATPKNQVLRQKIEARFSALYGELKVFGDIAIDYVVMAPEMLRQIKNVRIYQIDLEIDHERQYAFHGLGGLNSVPPASLYEMVYDANLETDDLEDIFALLNDALPPNYHGRSLSVSDIVELYDVSGSTFYFCDTFGFKEVSFEPEHREGESLIEIYFGDLSPEKQQEILDAWGDNGNYDVYPIAVFTREVENN
jgi:hypothetical protein